MSVVDYFKRIKIKTIPHPYLIFLAVKGFKNLHELRKAIKYGIKKVGKTSPSYPPIQEKSR